MRLKVSLSLILILAMALFTSAQEVQPVPLPNAPQPTGSAGNDSGYNSVFLLNHDWTIGPDDADNAFLRLEANRQRRGVNPAFVGDMIVQGQHERDANRGLLVGVAPAPGIPQWFNIGPIKNNHIQNG